VVTDDRPIWGLSDTELMIACGAGAALALTAVLITAWSAYRGRTLLPLYLLVGAGLAIFYEPINNVLGHFTYPELNQITWIRTFGRTMPLYMGCIYVFYFSVPVLLLAQHMQRGLTRGRWWAIYLTGCVLAPCFEWLPIHRGWWTYYGANQPLMPTGFPPAWWWFVDAQCIFGIATVLLLVRRSGILTERTGALLMPIVPMTLFAAHGSASIPAFTAISSSVSLTVTTAGALASIGLAVMNVWLLSRLAGLENPARVEAGQNVESRAPDKVPSPAHREGS
jgi:hypothetical protein